MLTPKQKQIFEYIKKYIKEMGYSPSLEEIGKHFKLVKSTVHQHVELIKEKGYLKKIENQPRSIEINKKQKNPDLITIPILGTITAGQPIEAIETLGETITISRENLRPPFKHYALRVEGDSMIDEGIFHGDVVIIREQQTADDGQTVVAIIDNNQATLKKIFREKKQIRLQPANQNLLPIFRTEVEIRGIMVKLLRNLENGVASRNELVKHIIKKNKTCNHVI